MSRKRHSTEQIISKLREAEIELAKGRTVGEVCKQIGVTDQTYCRWRKEYGGNGPEFTALAVGHWREQIGVRTLFIQPGSPWENGYIESFNGKVRDELLDGEIFYTLTEAKVLIERWRREYNTIRPHSSLGYQAPAPEVIAPLERSTTRARAGQAVLARVETTR